jgi:hypothetical protein
MRIVQTTDRAYDAGDVRDFVSARRLARRFVDDLDHARNCSLGPTDADGIAHHLIRHLIFIEDIDLTNLSARHLALARGIARDVDRAGDLAEGVHLNDNLVRDLDRIRVLVDGLDLRLAPNLRFDIEAISDLAHGDGAIRDRHDVSQVAPMAGRLVEIATRLLPVRERVRYADEFKSELWEIAHASGALRPQLIYAARLVMSAGHLRAELRVPRRRGASQ